MRQQQTLAHPGARIVWIHVAFSARFEQPRADIDQRLNRHLHGTGIAGIVTSSSVVLVHGLRSVAPAEWTEIIGWLLAQPEVVFVARLLPVSRRSHVCG